MTVGQVCSGVSCHSSHRPSRRGGSLSILRCAAAPGRTVTVGPGPPATDGRAGGLGVRARKDSIMMIIMIVLVPAVPVRYGALAVAGPGPPPGSP